MKDKKIVNMLANSRSKFHVLLEKAANKSGQDRLAQKQLTSAWNTGRSAKNSGAAAALRYGNLMLGEGRTAEAIEVFSSIRDYYPKNAAARYKLGLALERDNDWVKADAEYRVAQELQYDAGRVGFRRGRCLAAIDATDEAMAQYRIAIRHNYRPGDSYLAILSCERSAPVWKKLETLRNGTEHHSGNADWLKDRAVMAQKMRFFDEAVSYYRKSEELAPLPRQYMIEMAFCYQEIGNHHTAAGILNVLVGSEAVDDRVLGPGLFFKERGRWEDAIEQYKLSLMQTFRPVDRARLEFEIAHAFDRQYQWKTARDWYLQSLTTDGTVAYRHYRLGVVLERLEDFKGALGPYARSLELGPERPHWYYRLGTSARKAGLDDIAFKALIRSVGGTLESDLPDDLNGRDEGRVNFIRSLGAEHVRCLDERRRCNAPARASTWEQMLETARNADDESQQRIALSEMNRRSARLKAPDAAAYANMLHDSGEYDVALEVLEDSRDVRFPDGLNLKRYLSSSADRRRSLFAEFQKNLPLNDDVVLLESNHGASVGCHPLAIFRQMCRDERFDNFTFVWCCSDSAAIPEDVMSNSNVILVEVHSDVYLKYLATARYLINNVSFAPYYVRRDGQIYLNTWHGTPLKTLGASMKQGVLEYENLARNFVQATHVASPNDLTDWALFEDHKISKYATAARRVIGSPRLDNFINGGDTFRNALRQELGVDDDETLVLYAPTWRGGVSDHGFDVARLVDDLAAMSGVESIRVFFRAHRLTEKLVSELSLPTELVPSHIDTSDLLSAVDVLVTDYSSIAFDYLTTRRPTVFYVPDLDEYQSARGLYIDPSTLPGIVCHNRDELTEAISRPQAAPSREYDAAIEKYAALEDGGAAVRAIDFMLEPERVTQYDRPLVLIHASLIPNGIASALISLLQTFESGPVDIVLVVEGHVMRREAARQEILRRLPDHVDLAFRIGKTTATPEEQWAIDQEGDHLSKQSAPIEQLKRSAWSREVRRALGSATPDTAIEFDGYARLWADFIANAGTESTSHLIWQHNQLVDEWKTKYPELASVFKRYSDFDAIVPVSNALSEENRRQLQEAGFQPPDRFLTVQNTLNVEDIRRKARDDIDTDLGAWIRKDNFNVLSIGRLSPEKNFRALIDAWPEIVRSIPQARLTVIGSGLLEVELLTRVEELGISDTVFFAGQRSNPYPALQRADLFVLPSVHEGQPVVVLEAMTLNVPVAAAYTPGTAELLRSGYGAIVESSAMSMARDIVRVYKEIAIAHGNFDADNYADQARDAFLAAIRAC